MKTKQFAETQLLGQTRQQRINETMKTSDNENMTYKKSYFAHKGTRKITNEAQSQYEERNNKDEKINEIYAKSKIQKIDKN